ncbi:MULTISPECIES: DUF262 domain-containing protein [Halomonadaceae]|uniref:DUF262 domain-containing protein n=1 Tax=Vreelandella halophila TaxID=86177 RepID=A0A9X5B5I5_9GAMM|nr:MULTISPECIES: DUF262 domain-containing protein [Halomonas]MYL26503.1 DUF262 domain-containing protein [Halomonas utahensis]MYL73840.1 DUF262 domain-containing protein [Halomonas sp. 22501_18_FS]
MSNKALEEILEETDGKGEGTGIEAEDSFDEDGIETPFDPKKIDVITQQRTVDLLMKRLREGELNLSPDFQRKANLWSDAVKSSLIESMLLRIPIPSLYVSEDEEGNYEVVDGLQRLCAIAHFYDVHDLNKEVGTALDPLKLRRLNSLTDFEGDVFRKLPRPFQRRIEETELTLHIIRPGTPKKVKFNIFSRINRGGLPLKGQEIRNAIFSGKWREVVRELAESEQFKKATEYKVKGSRLEDHELVLRFVCHYILFSSSKKREDDQNLDSFLNDMVEDTLQKLTEDDWKNVKSAFFVAMERSVQIFGRLAFRKYSDKTQSRKPINKGLFESESVAMALMDSDQFAKLQDKNDQFMEKFAAMSLDAEGDFYKSMYSATGRGWASNTRIEALNESISEIVDD